MAVGLVVEAASVQIATLPKEQFPPSLGPLLRLLFFSPRPDAFLSATATRAELTVIAPPDQLSPLDRYGLRRDETSWRVVRVGEGAMGFEKEGVIERITGSLAAASIPVLYVSTFSSDYVLVPSTRLEEALRVLHHPQAPSSEGSNSGEEYIPSPSVVSQHSHPLNVLNASTRIVQVCSAGVTGAPSFGAETANPGAGSSWLGPTR
ncbi:MAG: hypothetical protein SGPRY_014293, partial [Prymnesium sp.]